MRLWIIFWVLLLVGRSYGQEIQITDRFDNISLTQALLQLGKNHHLKIAFDRNKTKQHLVTYSWRKASLEEVIDDLLDATELTFEILGDREVLIRAKPSRTSSPYLTGSVIDKQTGNGLPFATIQNGSKYTASNENGHFLLHLEDRQFPVIVRYLGYESFFIDCREVDEVVVALKPDNLELKELVIEEGEEIYQFQPQFQKWEINHSSVNERSASGESDVFTALRSIPGITNNTEYQNGISFRGSDPGQNLISMDGFKIYHPDHFFGLFSTIEGESVQKTSFYRTGFGAQYGGVTSSIVYLHGTSGNLYQPQASIHASPLSFSGSVELPVVKGKTSLYVSGRQSYIRNFYPETFRKMFGSVTGTPENLIQNGVSIDDPANTLDPDYSFNNYFIKAKHIWQKNHVSTLSFFSSKDYLNYIRRDQRQTVGSDSVQDFLNSGKSAWQNLGASLNWHVQWSSSWYSHIQVSTSAYESDFANIPDNNLIAANREQNNSRDWTFNLQNEYQGSTPGIISFGLTFNYFKYNYLKEINDFSLLEGTHQIGRTLSPFLEWEWPFENDWQLTTGLRMPYFDRTSRIYWEPRLQLHNQLSKQWRIGMSYGIYHQFVHQISTDMVLNGNRSFWIITDGTDFPITRSVHWNTNINYSNAGFTANLDLFRIRNQGIVRYAFQSADVAFDNALASDAFLDGSSAATGAELSVHQTTSKYEIMASYGLNITENKIDEVNEARPFNSTDPRNEIKLFQQLTYNRFFVSSDAYYGDGLRYTQPGSLTLVSPPDGSAVYSVIDGTNINEAILDPIIRFDFGLGYVWTWSHLTAKIRFNLINALNRDNIVARSVRPTHTGTNNDPSPYEFIDQRSLPRMLTLRLSLQFH